MMFEWSPRQIKVDSRNGFNKSDIIYIVQNTKEIDVKPQKLKIQYLEYDMNAPYPLGDTTEIIAKELGWFKNKTYKIPHHWVGKTKTEAIANFFKYREQMIRNSNRTLMKGK